MYMKKWWLEFTLEDGRRWSGWINTKAQNKEDFPETIKGTFFTERREDGCRGKFILEDGTTDSVITCKMSPKEYMPKDHGSSEASKFIDSEKSLEIWERIDMKIEDCLNLKKTYVDNY